MKIAIFISGVLTGIAGCWLYINIWFNFSGDCDDIDLDDLE